MELEKNILNVKPRMTEERTNFPYPIVRNLLPRQPASASQSAGPKASGPATRWKSQPDLSERPKRGWQEDVPVAAREETPV